MIISAHKRSSHNSTYIAPYEVDDLIGAGHETDKYGNVHDETAHYNEVVEVWARQSNNPVNRVKTHIIKLC